MSDRDALRDAAEYLRLASTWIDDTDRHLKLKAAWERAAQAFAVADAVQDAEDDRLSVHLDVCPDCGETATSHSLDPPNLCTHGFERYVPVKFVESRVDLAVNHVDPLCPVHAQPADDRRMVDLGAERIAQAFHENYERLAPDFGYRTREASATPWADVPEQNRELMVATVHALICAGEFGGSASNEAKEPWEILRDAPSVTALACECENLDRGSYMGRDGHLHCDQCDGRMDGPASSENQP